MKIIPIAEESLGVRSVAMYVETGDLKILLDPGISLAPRRYGLPPHPRELRRVEELRVVMSGYVSRATYIFISHYHRDHFTVPYESIYMGTKKDTYIDIYKGKVVLIKSPRDLNYSQKMRYYGLIRAIKGIANKIIEADGITSEIGSTLISVSEALPHGPEGSRTGKVISITVDDGDQRLTFMPDVQGPISEKAISHVISMKPSILVIGGPPLYLSQVFSQGDIEAGMRGLLKIIDRASPRELVITHHTLRSIDWRNSLSEIFSRALARGVEIITYAQIVGKEEELLEARRRELFETEPPPEDYIERFRNKRGEED
jgi:predicted metallo-beta-lactamase superfamily hydrolase